MNSKTFVIINTMLKTEDAVPSFFSPKRKSRPRPSVRHLGFVRIRLIKEHRFFLMFPDARVPHVTQVTTTSDS